MPFCAFLLLLCGLLFGWYVPHATLPPQHERPLLIAHRGVHQTFPAEGVENDTCTAQRIYPPTHYYIENTLESMSAAFAAGADMVELDIHPTTDNKLAVFHDWTVDCRTNGTGVTQELSMTYLKTLDIGYGYTADGGKTFPLRGLGVGKMPELQEVFDMFPDKQFGINFKDDNMRSADMLADRLEPMSSPRRAQFAIFGSDAMYARVKARIPEVRKIQPASSEEKACIPAYLMMLLRGTLSEECRRSGIAIPAQYLQDIPAWPGIWLHQAAAAGLDVTVAELEGKESFEKIKGLPLAIIETNTIEDVGPAYWSYWRK